MKQINKSSRHSTRQRRILWLAAAVSAPSLALQSWALPAWAQTATDDNQSLDTVTVVGTVPTYGDTPPPAYAGGQVAAGGRIGILGEKDAMDVPFNVISYTSDLIENQQSQTLGDTLQNDASVMVGKGFGNYSESFKIRGLDINGDDVAYGGLYGVLPRQIVLSDVAERIEVLKGASAFASGIPVGGTGGVGGTINIEPKHATDEPILKLSTGYTSDSYGEVGIDAGRRFGDQKQFGARISASRGRGDMAIDDEERRNTSVVVGLDYRGERGRVLFDIGHQKSIVNGGRSMVSLGALADVPDAPDSTTNYTPSWAGTRLETNFAMLRGEYDINDAWTAYAAVGGNKTLESGVYASPTVNDANGDASVSLPMDAVWKSKSFASQAGVRGDFDTGPVSHQLNLGYSSIYQDKYDGEWKMANLNGETNIYHPRDIAAPDWSSIAFSGDTLRTTRVDGVTLSDTLGFLDERVLLTLGARYQELDIDDHAGSQERGHRVTPAYGIVVKPTQHISLYANHVEGLQTAGASALPEPPQPLGIIHAKQNEVGAKFDYDTLGGGISLFEIKKPGDQESSNTVVQDDQRTRGLELSLYGAPMSGVRLLGSATWLDAELTKTKDGAIEGNDIPGVASYRYVLYGEWDIPHVDRLTATGRVIRTGSQYADKANDLELDPWTRLDLGLRYTMPVGDADWIWRAGIDNVTDEDYWASASTVWPNSYLVQGEPRTFKLSATVEF
ncbi:TonB-dependent receptor [Salinicola peritrichatus]|uniref:TonB-dependent receptor n=1 Tax=Salinicola peritrichatus TaxID=1267424 RepID=UPI000DA218AB|nr:TonB-dependent siderophore receptor [Salinicola peritrichatus]